MASLNSSCFGLLQLNTSTFKKLSSESVKSASFSSEYGCIVSESNNLTKVYLPTMESSFLSASVVQVSCCESALGFVTTSGFLYTMGEDTGKFGILGIKNCFSTKVPSKVQINVRIESVSISCKHAAALSAKGELFTWGTGTCWELGNCAHGERILPSVVQTAKIFLIKQITCGLNLTTFCTAGGFAYLYGELPKSICDSIPIPRHPYTIKGMSDQFILKSEYCSNFLLLYNDQKEVFIVDSCMKTTKLPCKFSKISCSSSSIIGISKTDKLIHEFKPSPSSICKANNLSETAYFVDEVFSHKFQIFSGFFVSCGFSSINKPITQINLQQLSLQKLYIDNSDVFIDSPDLGVKKGIGKMFAVLNKQYRNLLKTSVFDIKYFANYRKIVLEKPLGLVLSPILMKIMLKALILKRNAWKKFLGFVENSRKMFEFSLIKKTQCLQNCLGRVNKRVFVMVIETFELQEFWRNQKIHIAERIFSVLSHRNFESKRQGFYSIRKFVKSLILVKRRISQLFRLASKSIKLQFFELLVHNHILKLRIYQIITQIISYSSAQSSRVLILKFFHIWKRNLVSLKIARISEKYVKSMKIKKMTEKLMQLNRKTLKSIFTNLKVLTRPNPHRFKVIFLANSIQLILTSIKKPVFFDLKVFKKSSKKFQVLLNTLIKSRFSSIISGIQSFISSRKLISLYKLMMKKTTKFENYQHRQMFKAFIKLSSLIMVRNYSPSMSSINFSPKGQIRSRLFKPSLSISTKKLNSKKLIEKKQAKTSTNLMVSQRNSLRKATFPGIFKAKGKNTTFIQKPPGSPSSLMSNNFMIPDDINSSFFSNITGISPRSTNFDHSPKKESRWEVHILALGIAIISSLLRSYLKSYTSHLLH